MKIVFSGHSDDIFQCECNDLNVYYDECKTYIVKNEENSEFLVVSGLYTDFGGTWHIAIGQIDEDVPIPDWPMFWASDCYTTILEIDVPEGTVVEPVEFDKELRLED